MRLGENCYNDGQLHSTRIFVTVKRQHETKSIMIEIQDGTVIYGPVFTLFLPGVGSHVFRLEDCDVASQKTFPWFMP